MRQTRAKLTDCTPYKIFFCEKEKKIINSIKSQYLERTGLHLSIERAVKILIRRNKNAY
jgi:hypothetical protein